MACRKQELLAVVVFDACIIIAEGHSYWYKISCSRHYFAYCYKTFGYKLVPSSFCCNYWWYRRFSPFFWNGTGPKERFQNKYIKTAKIAIGWSRQLCGRASQSATSNRVDKRVRKKEQPQAWVQAVWLFDAHCQVWQLWNDNVEWRLVYCAQYYSESKQTATRKSDWIRIPWKARLAVNNVWGLVWIW